MYHGCSTKVEEKILREYFQHSKPHQIIGRLGLSFKSKLFEKNLEDSEFKHLDYYPMMNSRFHTLGDSASQWSLNKNFKATYESFLSAMVQKKEMSVANKLVFVYNMQLQDRIPEALALFKSINLSSFQELTPQTPNNLQM